MIFFVIKAFLFIYTVQYVELVYKIRAPLGFKPPWF